MCERRALLFPLPGGMPSENVDRCFPRWLCPSSLIGQELQELAARTNGRVKGNISTVEMIRALRREGAEVVASEP